MRTTRHALTGILAVLVSTLLFTNCTGSGGNGGDPCVANPMGPGCPQPVDPEFAANAQTGLPDSVDMGARYPALTSPNPRFSEGSRGGNTAVRIFVIYPDGTKVRVIVQHDGPLEAPAFLQYFFRTGEWLVAETAWVKVRYELGNVANIPADQSPNPLYDSLEKTVGTRNWPGN